MTSTKKNMHIVFLAKRKFNFIIFCLKTEFSSKSKLDQKNADFPSCFGKKQVKH